MKNLIADLKKQNEQMLQDATRDLFNFTVGKKNELAPEVVGSIQGLIGGITDMQNSAVQERIDEIKKQIHDKDANSILNTIQERATGQIAALTPKKMPLAAAVADIKPAQVAPKKEEKAEQIDAFTKLNSGVLEVRDGVDRVHEKLSEISGLNQQMVKEETKPEAKPKSDLELLEEERENKRKARQEKFKKVTSTAKAGSDMLSDKTMMLGGILGSQSLMGAGMMIKTLTGGIGSIFNMMSKSVGVVGKFLPVIAKVGSVFGRIIPFMLKALPLLAGPLGIAAAGAAAVGAAGYFGFKKYQSHKSLNQLEDRGLMDNAAFGKDKVNFERLKADPTVTADDIDTIIEHGNVSEEDKVRLSGIKANKAQSPFVQIEKQQLMADPSIFMQPSNMASVQQPTYEPGTTLERFGDAAKAKSKESAQTASTINAPSTVVNNTTNNVSSGQGRKNRALDRMRDKSAAGYF